MDKNRARLLFAVVCLALSNGRASSRPHHQRVINGNITEPGEFPSMVAIFREVNDYPHCGGVVIDRRHILTAGHCTDGGFGHHWNLLARVGCHSYRECTRTYKIETFKTHPLYRIEGEDPVSTAVYNDIAVLRTSRPIEFTGSKGLGSVSPISYADSVDDDYREGDLLTAIGWGSTSHTPGGEKSIYLRKADLRATSEAECKENYSYANITASICAKNPSANMCHGDSGGPLVQTREDGAQLVIGLTSDGHDTPDERCLVEFGLIFTRVAPFKDWIEETIGDWTQAARFL